jgi:hypothetical protein
MSELKRVATSFIEIAHAIAWCSAATVDRKGRPRSRILHPIWEWDGASLVGWVAAFPTALMRGHLNNNPYMSCTYWAETQNTCTAECNAELLFDDETRIDVWQKFKQAPPPVGYDPGVIAHWTAPTSDAFAVIRLDSWRLRVFPATSFMAADPMKDVLAWER